MGRPWCEAWQDPSGSGITNVLRHLSGGGPSSPSRTRSPETQNADSPRGWVLLEGGGVTEVGPRDVRLEVPTEPKEEHIPQSDEVIT